jgi:hypothetical protein
LRGEQTSSSGKWTYSSREKGRSTPRNCRFSCTDEIFTGYFHLILCINTF